MMKIENNKVVSLSYILKVDGEEIETVSKDKPMEFVFGTGYLLPKFEQNILQKQIGDSFDFVLKADEAYGNVDPEAVIDLSKEIFMVDGAIDNNVLFVGNQIPMRDQDGNRLYGVVESIQNDTVTMNFNHPLAGCDLHFKGEVVGVRDVTPEDLASGGCGCGCSSGGCGDEGCGDKSGGCCGDEGCGCQ